MKGLLRSKLVLTLAAFLMIAAAIVVPLSGSITHSHAQAPTSTPFGPVTITTTDCTNTSQSIATFNKGDVVSGTVDYTNASGESEDVNETLLLKETNGPFSLTITVNTGSHSFNFTAAANNDSLTGCIQNIDTAGEADQTATISGTITHTGTPTPTPTPPTKHQTLIVLLQGINTSLDAGQTTIPDFYNSVRAGRGGSIRIPGIAPFLKSNGYANAQFLSYSYKGSNPDGSPQMYPCLTTFTQHISQDANLLGQQINAALTHNPALKGKPTDIYLIGHSLGGAVAYTYLTALLNAPTVVPALPSSNDSLKGVITLDSPVGGVSSDPGFRKLVFDINKEVKDKKTGKVTGGCAGLTNSDQMVTVSDLTSLFDTTSKQTFPAPDDGKPNDNQGAHASVLKILGGKAQTNQELAEIAATMGTHVLTIGNNNDFLYNPSACHLAIGVPAVNFKTSQWIEDEAGTDDTGDIPGVYSRQFTAGTGICESAAIFFGVNHKEVYNNTAVENGLVQFLAGGVPDALNPAPPNP